MIDVARQMWDDLTRSACSERGANFLQNPMQASLHFWGAAPSFGPPWDISKTKTE
jgi:hypothetical protein